MPPLQFETRLRQRTLETPENVLVVAILLIFRQEIRAALNEQFEDEELSASERQVLVGADEQAERELAAAYARVLIEQASHTSTSYEPDWEHGPATRPDYAIERADPLEIRHNGQLTWREPPVVLDAKYYLEGSDPANAHGPIKKLLGDTTLLGAQHGALFFPELPEPSEGGEITRAILDLATDQLPERSAPVCLGRALDEDTINAGNQPLNRPETTRAPSWSVANTSGKPTATRPSCKIGPRQPSSTLFMAEPSTNLLPF